MPNSLGRHPPQYPHRAGRDGHLLTTARDEDLHRVAERSHSPLGDSSHANGVGGIGGHHGQDGQAGVQRGFGGDVLLQREGKESLGGGRQREGNPEVY